MSPDPNQPDHDQVERVSAALLPFIHAWGFSVNPEDVDFMAWTVLKHGQGQGPPDKAEFLRIDEAVRSEIEEYGREMEAFQKRAYGNPDGGSSTGAR